MVRFFTNSFLPKSDSSYFLVLEMSMNSSSGVFHCMVGIGLQDQGVFVNSYYGRSPRLAKTELIYLRSSWLRNRGFISFFMFTCNVITNLPENMHCNSAVCPRKALVFSEYTPRGSILLCEESVKVKTDHVSTNSYVSCWYVMLSLYLNLALNAESCQGVFYWMYLCLTVFYCTKF